METNSVKQIFGYSPLEEFQNTDAWRKDRRASLAPLVDAEISYLGQMETNKVNAELAQKQNDFNLQMWEKQNAYNSPEATMRRLTEAGINPRAYQQIGQFANAESPKPAERPEYNSPLGKLAKFTEKAQIDLARQKLLLDKINMSKDIAVASADKILAYSQLDHLKDYHDDSIQLKHYSVKTDRIKAMVDAIGKYGIQIDQSDPDNIRVNYDHALLDLPREYKEALIRKIEKEIETLGVTQREKEANIEHIGTRQITDVGGLLINLIKALF